MIVLRDLDLSENQPEGMIPESFGNLCSLQTLNLSANHLHGPLAFLRKFSSCANNSVLESIRLYSNIFSGSLPELSVFPLLKEIDLHNNELNGNLTTSVGKLFELETLDVSDNNFEGVISELHLSNLSNLRSLDLSFNLVSVNLSSNWVPSFHLEFLNLGSCKLGPDFPNWLAIQKKLSYLDISFNKIYGIIPQWFRDFAPSMYYISLSNNALYGRLPNLSTMFPSLAVLDLHYNMFEGPLPPIPSNLTILNLSHNILSGSILSLCNITTFMYLDLSSNRLSGGLPDYCVSIWADLRILNLAYNSFSGKIPSSIGSLLRIQTLNLGKNRFFGELPQSLRDCGNLISIDLSGNKFSGKVPFWIGESLLSLKSLILRSNEYNGIIPLSLCGLINLQILDLADNNIFGKIPECLDQLTAMINSGSISGGTESYDADGFVYTFIHPDKLIYQSDAYLRFYENNALVVSGGRKFEYSFLLLQVIDLSSNNLTGKFPEEMCLSGLMLLNLSGNNLFGDLPQNMGEMVEIEALDLSKNRFSGEIPTSLIKLTFLEVLNLSYNNLYGRVPSGFQFDTFDNSSYFGNQALCGLPLTKNCPFEATSNQTQQIDDDDDDGDEFKRWFFVGMGMGFFIGFWGIFGSLCLNRSWRHAYFLFLFKLEDWLLLRLALYIARFQRRFDKNNNH